VARNRLADAVCVEMGNLLDLAETAHQGKFAAVMTNPPFHAAGGSPEVGSEKAMAMHDLAGPKAWISACAKRLMNGGQLVVIYRADRLPSLLSAMDPIAGAIEIIPLWPTATSSHAKRVLVRGRKGARAPAIMRRGLVLHELGGCFTAAAETILRNCASLDEALSHA
jgi:tRNA1(Val) A37 N6-methylase TrmN6